MSLNGLFDAVLISASPMALTEALLLAREGKRVLVIDRRESIGGAWRTEDAFGYTDLEVGCHIFIEHPNVAIALRTLWRVQLAPLLPRPCQVVHYRGHYAQGRYGGPGVGALATGLTALDLGGRWLLRRQQPANGGLKKSLRLAWRSQHLLRAWLRTRHDEQSPFLYPSGGTSEIVRALSDRAKEAGVAVLLGSEALDVDVSRTGATIKLTTGATISAGQLVLTRGSQIDSINGLVLPKIERLRRHWVVVVEDSSPPAFSYLQFYGHPAVARVSDVTKFAKPITGSSQEAGRKILCFYVQDALYEGGVNQAEARLLTLMKQRGWVGPSAKPLDSGWWTDQETSRDYRPLMPLQEVNPALRIIPQANLGVYLRDNFARVFPGASPSP